MYPDELIYDAIQGCAVEHPQDLVGILWYVDRRERIVLSFDELSGGLRRLHEQGLVREASHLTFYDAAGVPRQEAFSELSPQDHQEACEEYARRMERLMRQIEEEEAAEGDGTNKR